MIREGRREEGEEGGGKRREHLSQGRETNSDYFHTKARIHMHNID